jgi:putative FmdB family regulatory protein
MPIFEYRCRECGHRFDAFFRRADEADREEVACPVCGSEKARKLFSVIGIGTPQEETAAGRCDTRST